MEIAKWAAAMATRDSIAQNYHKKLIKKPWLRAPLWQALCSTAEPVPQVKEMDREGKSFQHPLLELNINLVYLLVHSDCAVKYTV